MTANQAMFSIATMSKTLGVSRSGFYAWRERAASARSKADAALTERIKAIHKASSETYGAPRIHAELIDDGIRVGRKRVERLMKAAGLAGVSRRKSARTTVRDERLRPASDLVDRNFHAEEPEPALGGRHHLRADLGRLPLSGRRAGCLLAPHRRLGHGSRPEGPARARCPQHGAHPTTSRRGHPSFSDQGSQYTSIAFGLRCKEAGVRPSMGSVGDAYDNAMCESFFATLECELLDRRKFRTKAEARMAVFQFIEGWYNPGRRHSALGYQSPINYERSTRERLESASP